uniref:Uncharacterized protein n=1 Tax=Arundo donax TaxID=35708 RepID=A0A0A9E210_ARUDO
MYGLEHHGLRGCHRECSTCDPDPGRFIPRNPFCNCALQRNIAPQSLALHCHLCNRTYHRFRAICKLFKIFLNGSPVISYTTLHCHRINHDLVCQRTEERIIQRFDIFCDFGE